MATRSIVNLVQGACKALCLDGRALCTRLQQLARVGPKWTTDHSQSAFIDPGSAWIRQVSMEGL